MLERTLEETTNEPVSLGILLRQARLAKNWTVEQVSDRLKISKDKIIRIENDQVFEDMNKVYFRGYVRNYARLLEVDVSNQLGQTGTLLQLDYYSQRELKGAIDLPVYQHKRQKHGRLTLLVRLFIPFLLIAAVFVWWKEQGLHRSSVIALPSVSTSAPAVSVPLSRNKSDAGQYIVSRVTSGTVAGK